MLVLSRAKDERIVIRVPGLAEDIVVTVVELRPHRKARIGIDAPKEVIVHRQEIMDVIDRTQEAPA